jgi:hypothetical protein
MAVLKTQDAQASKPAASLLDQIVDSIDSKSPANINYVKARMAIEAAGLARSPKRDLKMVVISYLKGDIRHPDTAGSAKAPNQVVFADGTRARF